MVGGLDDVDTIELCLFIAIDQSIMVRVICLLIVVDMVGGWPVVLKVLALILPHEAAESLSRSNNLFSSLLDLSVPDAALCLFDPCVGGGESVGLRFCGTIDEVISRSTRISLLPFSNNEAFDLGDMSAM
jgi:hypothetical protein